MNQEEPPKKIPFSLEVLFLSFLGVGFAPFAPGTFGTLATLPFLYFYAQFNLPSFFLLPFALLLTVISCLVADFVQKRLHVHDPSWIVIDEVVGMLLTYIIAPGSSLLHFLFIFLLFRFFDITKIWPASFFDKKIRHGAGTILDDVVSGIYAGIVMLLLQYFFPALS